MSFGDYSPFDNPLAGASNGCPRDRLQVFSYGGWARNMASDPEWVAKQERLAWEDHLQRVEWLRRMAIYEIKRQPFFGTV